MKTTLLLLFFLTSLSSFSQMDKIAGDYKLTLDTKENDLFEYQLTLSSNGTFYFHYYSNIKRGIPPEINKYGKGKWSVENDVITFSADKPNDLDEKYLLDFTDSKARFIMKSPRDKTDQIIKTRLKFLKSEISWMRTIELLKI